MKREIAASAVAALVLTGTSAASWSGSGTGSAATRATTMGAGNAPTASAPTLSTNVTVSWTRASYGNGVLVAGYVVRRYNALTGTAAAVGASCSGVVTGASCTENGVTPGSWKYTVAPAQGAWRGTESAQGAAVTVPGL